MAYRRYLLRRTNLSNCNFHPSFSYVLHHTIDEPNQRQQEKPVPAAITSLIQARSFGSFLNGTTGFGASSKRRTIFNNTFSGYSLCRYLSTLNDDSDKINFGIDVADVLAETTIDTVASQAGSVVDEVAIAAADSLLPIKMVQYAIDYVHFLTGMNWWAAIVMTTFLVRIATVPFLVNQLKANSRFRVLRLKVDEIIAQLEDKASGPAAVAEGQKQITKLYKEFGVSPLPLFHGLIIQASILISFFCAISNMAEKMPSFKHGGAYWFTDLTTPDSLYIFPVLTALSFLISVLSSMPSIHFMTGHLISHEKRSFGVTKSVVICFIPVHIVLGLYFYPVPQHNVHEGSHCMLVETRTTMKNLARAVSVLVVPFAMELPKRSQRKEKFRYSCNSRGFSTCRCSKIPALKQAASATYLKDHLPFSPMAYRRYLLRRTNLSNCNFRPSFSYVLHHTIDEPNQRQQEKPVPAAITSLIQARSFGSFLKGSTGFGASSKRRTIFNNTFSGYSLCRYMSTLNDDSDKINFGIDVADVLAETTIDTVASQAGSVVDEVAIAAADSLLPVKMVQYAIDYVHSFTGMNWWAAIVMTTFLVRIATIPSLVNQLKANSRFHVLRLKVDEIKAQMEDKESDPAAVAEGQKQIAKLFKDKHNCWTAIWCESISIIAGVLYSSFYLDQLLLCKKMPSFKHGGAYWFTDLTTPDSLYIFPVLTALSFLVIVEHIVQEASYGTVVESSTTMKNLSRAVSVLVVPCAMELPKAILCFWLTSNLFLIIYGLVISVPSVKKSLGIPVIVVDSAPADAPKSQR
ncbi:hypothetical protein HN873_044956 [Arachis hypogaea]